MVSLTNRPAPKSVIRSGARRMTRIGRSSEVVAGPKKPDYLINGKVYDHYAPSTDVPRNIWSEVKGKVDEGQTNNVVISLRDSDVQEEALRRQFEEWRIEDLREVIIIRRDGTIGRL